ncbi:hypothetical protein [Desulfosarcina widdelii]|uniref:hypothetical protein n=1 Tax=Desulfosarcina widdelii TaxID=947919 RepID=UPI0012D2B01A|nr:hypothetical protein [Desulfosarcina widdelii]
MKVLGDKGIMFRTYPVVPRKRVKFDPDIPVEFTEFGSGIPTFQCLGGYFTHHSYRLLDFFVSHWFEIARRNWTLKFGGQYPSKLSGDNLEKLKLLTPILNMAGNGSLDLEKDLVGLCHAMNDYVVIDSISDRVMRSHPSLKRLSSAELYNVIDRTSTARLKVNYSVRTIRASKKNRQFLGYSNWSNLGTDQQFSKLLDYRLLDEVKGADGRILERVYKFGFMNPLGLAMIHNTICGGSWSINPVLYQLSADAQLLYRYLIITGSRTKNHTADFLAHRLAWRETQKSRIIQRLKVLFEEVHDAGLIESYEAVESQQYGCLFSYKRLSKNTKKERC